MGKTRTSDNSDLKNVDGLEHSSTIDGHDQIYKNIH